MYRFALAESASPRGYVRAAQEAGEDAVNMQRVVDSGTPNYARQALTASNNASLERVSKRSNDLMLKEAELLGEIKSDNLQTKFALDKDRQAIEGQKKFAGKLALAGYSVAEAFRKEEEIPGINYDSITEAIKSSTAATNAVYDRLIKSERSYIESLTDNPSLDPENPSTVPDANNPGFGVNVGDEVGPQALVYPVGGGSPYQTVNYTPGPDLTNPNRYALSQVVQHAEGTRGPDAYRVMFGHSASNPRLINDFSRHPNNPYPTPWGKKSEAAGAYQFMMPTWNDITRANPEIRDFSPESQERAFDFLANRRGVNPTTPINNINDFTDVMTRFSPEWASLPYKGGASYYNQPIKKIEELWNVYQDALKKPPYPAGMI